MKNINKTLYLLSGCELTERFSYFGLLTILVLQLDSFFKFDDAQSFVIFGLFLTLSYALLIWGGLISDRWLGAERSILIGGTLLILGNTVLAFTSQLTSFYLALAFITMGTALFKVNTTNLIGEIATQDHKAREKNFTIFYSAMNIGSMLSPLVYGIMIQHSDWHYCFLLSAILIAVILTVFAVTYSKSIAKSINSPKPNLAILLILLTCAAITCLFIFAKISNLIIIPGLIVSITGLFYFAIKQDKKAKKALLGILIINSFSALFFACSLQVASSVTLFIKRDIDKLIFGWHAPASSFTSLDPLFVVLLAPLFPWIWRKLARINLEPYLTTKISIGLLLASLGFFCLYLAAEASATSMHAALVWLFISYVLLGGGEICLSPPVLAAISHHSPRNFKSTIMGSWFLFTAFGAYLAGQLSTLTDNPLKHDNHLLSSTIYAHGFIEITIFALVCAFIAYLLKRYLRFLFT